MFFPKYIQKSTITKSKIKFFLFLRTGKIYMNLLHCFLDYLWKSSKFGQGGGGSKNLLFFVNFKNGLPRRFFQMRYHAHTSDYVLSEYGFTSNLVYLVHRSKTTKHTGQRIIKTKYQDT